VKRLIERDKPKEVIFKTLVQDYFVANPKVDKAIVEIKEDKLTRSDAQNKLLWVWNTIIADEVGELKDDMHFKLVSKILGVKTVKGFDGQNMDRPVETKKLKVAEMKDYLEKLDMFIAGWGIVLPHPEYYWLAMGVKAP